MTEADYYNDFDPGAAAWLRELMAAGLIPAGRVDDRTILDVSAADVARFRRAHFFAGIGGWAEALRLAGWPDWLPVWTGSPPCQPFASPGKRRGRDDPRHLGPRFVHLVGAARPPVLFGEQVASADAIGRAAGPGKPGGGGEPAWAWWDDLSLRLEAAGYAAWAAVVPAAGIGAPHIRQRLFFAAVDLRFATDGLGDRLGAGLEGLRRDGDGSHEPGRHRADAPRPAAAPGAAGGMADQQGLCSQSGRELHNPEHHAEPCSSVGGMADDARGGRREERADGRGRAAGDRAEGSAAGSGAGGGNLRPCPTNGFWSSADWLLCRDGDWRPVEPGTFPLAHGIPGRVGLLRGYGNAIVPQAAAEFIAASREILIEAGIWPRLEAAHHPRRDT